MFLTHFDLPFLTPFLLALVYLPTGQKLVKKWEFTIYLHTYVLLPITYLPSYLPIQRALQQFKLRIRLTSRFLSSSFSAYEISNFAKIVGMNSPIP
jgi:hypothetical protein